MVRIPKTKTSKMENRKELDRIKYCAYFRKRFLGIGVMLSYRSTPILYNEQIVFDLRLLFFHLWVTIDL